MSSIPILHIHFLWKTFESMFNYSYKTIIIIKCINRMNKIFHCIGLNVNKNAFKESDYVHHVITQPCNFIKL